VDLGLTGRKAFVTGGSRGIGLAIACGLAAEGVLVTICARGGERLAQAADEIAEHGPRPAAMVVDVTDAAALTAAVDQSARDAEGLDLLVANAGGSAGGTLLQSTPEDWMRTFEMNVLHAATAIRAGAPYLAASRHGAALAIGSISGWKPRAKSSYAVAKAAEIHLAPVLAAELGPLGIRVNTLSPGVVVTKGGRWERTRAADPEEFEQFVADNAPTGRLVTEREIADVACFLLSARASGVNGAHVTVDGALDRPTDVRPFPR
jgi:3-oxoacyl-[acyl-carrier protein] reductase